MKTLNCLLSGLMKIAVNTPTDFYKIQFQINGNLIYSDSIYTLLDIKAMFQLTDKEIDNLKLPY